MASPKPQSSRRRIFWKTPTRKSARCASSSTGDPARPRSGCTSARWDSLSDADKRAFLEAAKEGVRANRARVDEDERKAVADLRAKGMIVAENVDKAKFQAALAPAYADFAKRFGQANIDRIRNYR